MNVVERGSAPGTEVPVETAVPGVTAAAEAPPARRPKVRLLLLLLPYVKRYRGRALAAHAGRPRWKNSPSGVA